MEAVNSPIAATRLIWLSSSRFCWACEFRLFPISDVEEHAAHPQGLPCLIVVTTAREHRPSEWCCPFSVSGIQFDMVAETPVPDAKSVLLALRHLDARLCKMC